MILHSALMPFFLKKGNPLKVLFYISTKAVSISATYTAIYSRNVTLHFLLSRWNLFSLGFLHLLSDECSPFLSPPQKNLMTTTDTATSGIKKSEKLCPFSKKGTFIFLQFFSSS
jgi:hypothetical protein